MKRVCELQLDSFKRILSGQQETEIKEKLIENHVSEDELHSMITGVVRQYRDIKHAPSSLFHAYADLLGNFREALDFNSDSLSDFSILIPSMLRRLDLAIYISNHQNWFAGLPYFEYLIFLLMSIRIPLQAKYLFFLLLLMEGQFVIWWILLDILKIIPLLNGRGEFDISDVASGIYIVNVRFEDYSFNKKIIKQ